MNTAISREYWFSAAHRLEGHPKCGRLHGHNYRVVVVIDGPISYETGMLIDYGELDKIVKPIIDGRLDHKYLVSESNIDNNDPYWETARNHNHTAILPIRASTAEHIAAWLAQQVQQALVEAGHSMFAVSIRVDETHKSSAVVA